MPFKSVKSWLPSLIALLLVGTLCACRAAPTPTSPPAQPTSLPEPIPAGPLPEGELLDEFEGQFQPFWERSGDWRLEGGRAVAEAPGSYLFLVGEHPQFRLASRLNLTEDTALSLVFRARDEGALNLHIGQEGIDLLWDSQGGQQVLVSEQLPITPGWHDLELANIDERVTVLWDGELLFDFTDSEFRQPGGVGFVLHGGGRLEIEHVLLLPLDEETIAGEPPPEEGAIPRMVIKEPPIASLISFGEMDSTYMTQVTGAPGAVKPDSVVLLSCLNTSVVYFAGADEDGGFQAEIFAPPGTMVQVKHAKRFFSEQEFEELFKSQEAGGLVGEWVNATAGTIVRVPDAQGLENDPLTFSLGGAINLEGGGAWTLDGTIEFIDPDPATLSLRISGPVTVMAPGLLETVDPAAMRMGVSVKLVRLFDRQGRNLPLNTVLVSDFMTPTGFPIARGENDWSPIQGNVDVTGWQKVDGNSVRADMAIELRNEPGFPFEAGYYAPRVLLYPQTEFPLDGPDGIAMRSGIFFNSNGWTMPVLKIGEPGQPRLVWGLLTDTLSEATRGTLARSDQANIGLIPFTSLQSKAFVVPRDDDRSGQPLQYRLEPFVVLNAFTDRGVPNPPLIPFRFPSGELEVQVQKPDGSTDTLGPAPFVQSRSSSPAFEFGMVRDNNGGGALHDVYQLTTLDETFAYTFEQYGHHVITMEGTVEDIWGNTYFGGGVYDVYVARPLKLSAGVLPAAPFAAGDSFAPTVQVYPRLPADVQLDLQLLPDSDPQRAQSWQIAGQANPYGYFHPGEGFPAVSLDQGGEYRLEALAQYRAPDGTLWMGSMTWGSVVEKRDTPLIAHGARGIDVGDFSNRPLWFFHRNLEIEGVAHTNYPYYSGDIFWGGDELEFADMAADAILPIVTLQDTSGSIYEYLRNRWQYYHQPLNQPPEGFEENVSRDEVLLFSTTTQPFELSWDRQAADQFGYTYRSSERPGARVHESVSEAAVGIAYWRYNATYGDQVGVLGDLPNDLKWQFGGLVLRDPQQGLSEYAIYGSLWVLIGKDDPMGPRVMPPFQGATGGPNGGPIMVLKGEEIDLLFLPRSGGPGQLYETGDIFAFSGYVGPPLPSRVEVTLTSPSGGTRTISGRANKIGYFYDQEADFALEEAGVWTAAVQVVHDGMTSAGPTQPPYPQGSVLGAAQGRYSFYVAPPGAQLLEQVSPGSGYLDISADRVGPFEFTGRLPQGMLGGRVHYTIAMPGFLLEEGTIEASQGAFTLTYDPERLHEDFPNLDLTAYDEHRPGLADQVWITALVVGQDGSLAPFSATLLGERVYER